MILGAVLLFVIGAGMLIGGIAYRKNTQKKLDAFIPVTARVFDYATKTERDDDGYYRTLYAARVEYDVNGKTYKATDIEYSSSRPSIGSQIQIAYNPTNPNDVVFVKSASTVFIILLVLGGVFAVIGLSIGVMALVKK